MLYGNANFRSRFDLIAKRCLAHMARNRQRRSLTASQNVLMALPPLGMAWIKDANTPSIAMYRSEDRSRRRNTRRAHHVVVFLRPLVSFL